MLEEQVLHLFDFFSQPGGWLWAIAFLVGFPSVAVIVFFLNRRSTHPILTWIALSSAFFLFSQSFPENRSQMKELGIGTFLGGDC